ncbi:MAG TPA: hypothetical protein VI362_09215 [Ignavibacteriaceae bacterium]|nr:hypothetical protein [Ignavibacteriaceae bacterium]
MYTLLDILGSTVVGGILYLMLFQVNAQISSTSVSMLTSTFSSRNTVDAGYILEYDISKLGYLVANDFITTAEEHKIEFSSDLDNNGTVENVLYVLGNVNEMTGTMNPNDRPLYRKVANGDTNMVSVLRDFNISYLDSAGNAISYASLNNQTSRNSIRGIHLYLRIESSDPTDGIYPYIEFERRITPKNLGRI